MKEILNTSSRFEQFEKSIEYFIFLLLYGFLSTYKYLHFFKKNYVTTVYIFKWHFLILIFCLDKNFIILLNIY